MVKELFNIASYYIQGKPVYPAIRRILNLLFNISIASFIYEKCYGTYTWYNYNDYKEILDFFIKGRFFIPFSIFVVVYGLTQILSNAFFSIFNHFKSVKLQREILKYQFKKETIDERLADIQNVSKHVIPIELTPELILQAYHALRKDLKPEDFQKIENELKQPKQNIEANFDMAFSALAAITLYFFTLPQFGWLLYAIVSVVLIVGMYILTIAYRLLDVTPTILRQFHVQAEIYLRELEKKESKNNQQPKKVEEANE
jgi:hypothetical protein